MLESLVANVLNKTIGAYVENFDTKQLNIGIWAGNAKLRNLKLKKDAVESLKLPVDVKFGHLDELSFEIPWQKVGSQPAKITIDNMYLLVSPRLPSEFDIDEEKAREQKIKKEKLNTLEMMEKATSSAAPANSDGLFASLTNKVVNNLQITVKNIHLRYEDDSAFTEFPYAIGLHLSELSAVSTNDAWLPEFISDVTSLVYKLMTLNSLSLYWHTDTKSIYDDDDKVMFKRFQETIQNDNTADKQYILSPVSGTGKLVFNKKGATESHPHYDLQLEFDEFGLNLDSSQYHDMLWTTSQINWYLKTQKYRKLRPNVSIKEDPRKWLKYTIDCVYNEIHERNYKWTWEYLKKRRDQRLEYIRLWKIKIGSGGAVLPPPEQLELDVLETKLKYEDIKFYRSLAKIEYKKEHRTLPSPQPVNDHSEKKQGWVSSWWYGSKPETDQSSTGDVATEDLLVLSDEQRKELYDAIEYDDQVAISESVELPKDRIKSKIICRWNKGSFGIKKHGSSEKLAEIVFDGCTVDFLERPESYVAAFQLNQLTVRDGSDGVFTKEVVKSISSSHGASEPFFLCSFEKQPLNEPTDSRLMLKLGSALIFHNPKLFENVYRFFKPPKIHLDTIELIMNVAESRIDDFAKQTRIGLEYVFEEHKTMTLKMNIAAPLILVPVDPYDKDSPIAVLDAGNINIESDLVDNDEYERIKNEPKDNYTEEDWRSLNTLLYDKYILRLQDAKILICPNIVVATEQIHKKDDRKAVGMILENLNINLSVGVSIIPSYYNLPRIKIGGDVPRFRAMLTDYQYKIFMELIDKAIPNFDDLENFDSSAMRADLSKTNNAGGATDAFSDSATKNVNELRFSTFNRSSYDIDYLLDRDIAKIEELPDDASVGSSNTDDNIARKEKSAKVSEQQNQQHIIEFDFTIDKIELSLLKCSNAVTFEADELVDLVGKSLKLHLYKTNADIHVDLSLNDMQIDDHIELSANDEFKHLISSYKTDGQNDTTDLFKLDYHRSQRLVQFKNEVIEVFDQNIKMDIADFKVIVTRKSLLTLLNFSLNTFTDPEAPETPADQLNHNDEEVSETAPQHINVDINLKSIILVLNDDGIKLATMVLKEADVSVLVLPVKMKVTAKLGGVSLQEEVEDLSDNKSQLRQLIHMDGNDLAELYYETFDPETNKEEYSSLLRFSTGSMRIMFVEHAYTKIFSFLTQFLKMKAIYDSAREAALNQNYNLEGANLIKFDVLVKTPIIVFPEIVNPKIDTYNSIVLNLGEIYANNQFRVTELEGTKSLINIIKAGVRNTKIESTFHLDQNRVQKLEIIDDLDFNVDIKYHIFPDANTPTVSVKSSLTGTEVKLTDLQSHYILQVVQAIPRVLNYDSGSSFEDVQNDATNFNRRIDANKRRESYATSEGQRRESLSLAGISRSKTNGSSADTRSLADESDGPQAELPADHIKVDVDLLIPVLSLSLYDKTGNLVSIENTGLSRFALNETSLKLELKEDGRLKSDFRIKSFTVQDIRDNTDMIYTDIVPAVPQIDYQFMACANMEDNKKMEVDVVVDSPKVIVALDYLFALKAFSDAVMRAPAKIDGLQNTIPANTDDDLTVVEDNIDDSDAEDNNEESVEYSIKVKVLESSIILVTEPNKVDSKSLVFQIAEVDLESNSVFSVKASDTCLFLSEMDKPEESKLRIVDNFSSYLFLDECGSTANAYLTKIKMGTDNILITVSIRDILLAIETINNASEMYTRITGKTFSTSEEATEGSDDKYDTFAKSAVDNFVNYAASTISSFSHNSQNTSGSVKRPQVIIKGEELKSVFKGMRLVVMGDVHELPVVDLRVNPFELTAKNWSTDLEAFTNVETYINIFNYSNSVWEPLLEPWSFNVHVLKSTDPKDSITVDVVSHKSAEFVFTSRSIALISHVVSVFTDDNRSIRPREEDQPYLIINETGYDIRVWVPSKDPNEEEKSVIIKDGKSSKWQFEDWRIIRETLDVAETPLVSVELIDSPYNRIDNVSFKIEGENMFMLMPAVNRVHSRLVCEIVLGEDKIKKVCFKSTITVQNTTQGAIIVGTGPPGDELIIDREITIPAGSSIALPIDSVYFHNFAIRPSLKGQVFSWSRALIMTEDIQKKPVRKRLPMNWKTCMTNNFILDCPEADKGNSIKNYYFRSYATYDSDEGLATIYPHMTLTIAPPFQIENLLPCDIKWKVYKEDEQKSYVNTLKQGEESSVHVVDVNSNLLLQIQPLNCKYSASTFGVINNAANPSLKLDSNLMVTTNEEGSQKLHFKIHYVKSANSGVKYQIYSPYLILNRTNQKMTISDKSSNTLISQPKLNEENADSLPDMFSFVRDSTDIAFMRGNLRDNLVSVKVGDSEASRFISVDKVGQSFEVKVSLKNRELENNLGVYITEGEGSYNMTKIVQFAPRYVMKNDLTESIQVLRVGTTKPVTLNPNEILPLFEMSKSDEKQLMIGFAASKSDLSAPFVINDIGEHYIRVLKPGQKAHTLIRVVLTIVNATLFINFTDADNQWPFLVRNYSNHEFIIYQSDPYIDEDGARSSRVPFKPIYYRIPPKSLMPYAWDFPAGKIKELMLRSGKVERAIQLAEIGDLKPMVLARGPGKQNTSVGLSVMADGIIQCLVITNFDPSLSMYRMNTESSLSLSSSNRSQGNQVKDSNKFETVEDDEDFYTRVILRFEGFNVSLVNAKGQELCYTTMRGVELRYNESSIYQNVSLKVKWIQIDNQLYSSIYPIILFPTVVPKSSAEMASHPTFSAAISRLKDNSHGVTYIKFATILLQELTIEVDEDFLFVLLEFSKIPGAAWNRKPSNVLWDHNLNIPEPETIKSTGDYYFEALSLQPVQFNLSFVRTERINAEITSDTQNVLAVASNVLTMAIGNINDAPVRLASLQLENLRSPLPYLIKNVQEHYQQAFLYQIYKILGSADVLGNPVGLFNNISSGVIDIFYEPYQGFIMTDRPQELGIGLAKGGLSFVKKSVFGFSDSFAKFTGSMAKGLTVATLDRNFQERRRLARQRNRPKHPLYGLSSGATSLFEGISSGISGIATAPMEGASKEGASGFFKGLGKGLIGLPTKSATGIFDFASNIGESVRNTTIAFDGQGLDRVRLPRYISYDGTVTTYNERESQGQFWLKSVDGGKYFDDKYLAHVMLPGDDLCVIVSMKRIMIVSIVKMSIDWEVVYTYITKISMENTGIIIKQKDSAAERFIAMPSADDRRFIYKNISIAVSEYNKKCQVIL